MDKRGGALTKKMMGRLLAVAVAAVTATTVGIGTASAEDGWLPNWPYSKPIQNLHSNLCLIPYGGSDTPGADIVQFSCNGDTHEQWYLYYDQIRNVGSGLCLTPEGGWSDNDVQITQWKCDTSFTQNTNYQDPYIDEHGTNLNWQEVLLGSGKCLTVKGAWTTREAPITQYDCHNRDDAQFWHAIDS